MALGKNVSVVNDINFENEVLRASGPVLVDFGATWCGPCKALAPIVSKLADDGVGRYKVVSVDIDDAPGVATKYGIRSAPTVIVFNHGEPAAKHVGLTSRERLQALLAAASGEALAS
jgi:thioredoxin 1